MTRQERFQARAEQDKRTTIYATAVIAILILILFAGFIWVMAGAVQRVENRACITGTPAYQQQLNCGVTSGVTK